MSIIKNKNLFKFLFQKQTFLVLFIILLLFKFSLYQSNQCQALPYNFNTNQGSIEYYELIDPNFYVYFDNRSKDDGLIILNSLTHAKPVFDKWFGIKRSNKPLRIVSTPKGNSASFANFFFDSIELLTDNQNVRDLIWHEYAHIMTYQHLYNFLSPSGTILHLLWMPAWFLEGLAEAITVSTGSDFQSGIERWQSLTNNWPSYDRLHSLYQNPVWSYRGYATSGSFVQWIFRELYILRKKQNIIGLKEVLSEFKNQTMPWNLAVNFFNPIDKTLKKFLNRSSKTLYEQYKKQATEYWNAASPYPLLASSIKSRLKFKGRFSSIFSDRKNLFSIQISNQKLSQVNYSFKNNSNFVNSSKSSKINIKEKVDSYSFLNTKEYVAYIKNHKTENKVKIKRIYVKLKDITKDLHSNANINKQKDYEHQKEINFNFSTNKPPLLIKTGPNIDKLFYNALYLGWVEKLIGTLRVCYHSNLNIIAALNNTIKLPPPHCLDFSKQKNQMAKIIGFDYLKVNNQSPMVNSIWFRIQSVTLSGDKYKLMSWSLNKKKFLKHKWDSLAKPISVAVNDKKTWILASDRYSTYISLYHKTKGCSYSIRFSDYLRAIWPYKNDQLIVASYEGFHWSLIKIDPNEQERYPCNRANPHSSPILEAMRILAKNTSDNNSLIKAKDLKIDLTDNAIAKLDDFESVLFRTHPWQIKHFKQTLLLRKQGFKKNDTNKTIAQKRQHYSDKNLKKLFKNFRLLDQSVFTNKQRYDQLLKSGPIITKNLTRTYKLKDNEDDDLTRIYDDSDIKSYNFRFTSPVFFPWLGAQDYKGPQLGMLTIPLIDDLQNHQLRGIVLFGIGSYFPALNINYSNTRYRLPIELTIFKKLTYNGHFYIDKNVRTKTEASYLNEYGLSLSTRDNVKLIDGLYFEYILSLTSSKLSYFDGPVDNINAIRTLSKSTFSLYYKFANRFSTLFRTRFTLTPGIINNYVFDYYKSYYYIRFQKYFFKKTKINIGTEYAQTRGAKTMTIKEIYTPIKIFIPGSGLTSNKLRIPIGGGQALFNSIILGDSLIRNSINLTTPIISDANKKISVLYLKSIEQRSYINYGGIWSKTKNQDIYTHPMILAYGTSTNLLLENKGVNFYLGLGAGSYHLKGIDFFINVGFDAFF